MSDADTALVVRARAGDRSAFEELIRRTSRLVFARLYVDTGCPHRAEDLLQETYLLAYRSLYQLLDPSVFRSWLLTLSRNVLTDDVRKAMRVKRLAPAVAEVPLGGITGHEPEPHAFAEREELRGQVLAALRTVPEEYRLPITLRYILGMENKAIAEQLGRSESAVRSLIFRGLKLLRKRLPEDIG